MVCTDCRHSAGSVFQTAGGNVLNRLLDIARRAAGRGGKLAMARSPAAPQRTPVYQAKGYCPACERDTTFTAYKRNYRGALHCAHCRSVPRERALAKVLAKLAPGWRAMAVHESSPAPRGFSIHLKENCAGYIATNFYPGEPLGLEHNGFRNENLEKMTFADESLDLHVHLDVLEHVNNADRCTREMARTLKPGGMAIFTTPVEPHLEKMERRALYTDDGIEHFAEPEYHGNPAASGGALVTYKFGADLAGLLAGWAPEFDVQVFNDVDERQGVMGPYLEVFALIKRPVADDAA